MGEGDADANAGDPVVPDRHVRVDHYIHFPQGIPVNFTGELTVGLDGSLAVTVQPPAPPPPGPADHAVLTIHTKENQMPGTIEITVDDTGATAVLTFEDRVDEATGPPLSSDGSTPVVVQYTSDNTSIATVDPNTGILSEAGAGLVNIGATVNDAITGQPAVEPDGVTPFAPAPVAVQVNPGAAQSDVFTVNP